MSKDAEKDALFLIRLLREVLTYEDESVIRHFLLDQLESRMPRNVEVIRDVFVPHYIVCPKCGKGHDFTVGNNRHVTTNSSFTCEYCQQKNIVLVYGVDHEADDNA